MLENKNVESDKVIIEYGDKNLKDIINNLIEKNFIEEIKKIQNN